MAQRFGNPYQPATAIGQGLQNIAIGLFGNKGRGSSRNAELDAAHAGLYDEQAQAKAVERQLKEQQLRDEGEDAQHERIAARVGLPVHSVKAYLRELRTGGPNLHEYAPYAANLSDAMIAIRGNNPAHQARALLELKQLRDRDAIIAGADPTSTSRAYLATEAKPLFDNSAVGTFDLSTGVEKLNPYGTQKVDTEKKHGTAYQAAAGASGAAAQASRALAAQRELETRTGVRIGAPVFVDDGKGGVTYASPIAAVGGDGKTAAPRPQAPPIKAVLNADGTTTWERVAPGTGQQVGTTPPRPVAPRKVTPNDKKTLETAVGEALAGMELDAADLSPTTRNAIVKQAEIEFENGAAGHLNAVMDAINKVAPDSFELTGTWGARKLTAKGGLRDVQKPVPGRDAQPRPAQKPPATAPAAAPAAAGAGPVVPKISSDAEYNALPSGAEYIAPDGARRRKK
jgi:hypothetical protein